MLHPYVERVWSFGHVFSWEVIHYWLEYAQKRKKEKEKKSALFIIPFFIKHMYGYASLLHWVYVLERVHMRAYLWDSSWCIFFVRVWVTHSIFVRETSDFSLGSLDPCPIRHYIHFHETYLHALMQVDHHSHFYLFVFFYFYFIPPFHYTSSDSFLFSSCLMFDLGSTSTLYSFLFDISFIYYHFSCGNS